MTTTPPNEWPTSTASGPIPSESSTWCTSRELSNVVGLGTTTSGRDPAGPPPRRGDPAARSGTRGAHISALSVMPWTSTSGGPWPVSS